MFMCVYVCVRVSVCYCLTRSRFLCSSQLRQPRNRLQVREKPLAYNDAAVSLRPHGSVRFIPLQSHPHCPSFLFSRPPYLSNATNLSVIHPTLSFDALSITKDITACLSKAYPVRVATLYLTVLDRIVVVYLCCCCVQLPAKRQLAFANDRHYTRMAISLITFDNALSLFRCIVLPVSFKPNSLPPFK